MSDYIAASPRWVDYCCPRCKQPVAFLAKGYRCDPCQAHYPVMLGIADFRVFPDPYISAADDYEKAQCLAQKAETSDFATLVKFYWSITPDTPPAMASRFATQAFAAADRGRHLLSAVPPVREALDLGCRTGGLLLAAAERFDRVVGIDIAFRWLIVARKRLEEAGHRAQLVCCCAQFLPFAEKNFDLVLAENVLEHTALQQELITEAHRALRPRGALIATTWNRLGLAPEPHVRLWGVGWLPGSLAKRYVFLRRRTNYEHVRLLSIFQVRRMMRRTPFRNWQVDLAEFSKAELTNASGPQRKWATLYHTIKNWRFLRPLLLIFAPVFLLRGLRDPD